MSFIVSIIGRPNVGKSTLFNRLSGTEQAITSNVPGTTRDRLIKPVQLEKHRIFLVDTAGITEDFHTETEELELNMQKQSELAIKSADLIIFCVDIRTELTSDDYLAVDLLRSSKKPVILVTNKAEKKDSEFYLANFYRLGFGEPISISALQGYGIGDLEDEIEKKLDQVRSKELESKEAFENTSVRLTFVGRPNVGKSTLINTLIREERLVTSSVSGTTRDATEVPFEFEGHSYTLVDTAGIRRRGRIEKDIEKPSVLQSIQSIESSDIVVLLLDASEGIKNQDCHISSFALEENKGLILVLNKIDLYKGEEREKRENQLIYQLKQKMDYLPWAPVVFASGLTDKNLKKILSLVAEIHEERRKVIPEEQLQDWLNRTLIKHTANRYRGRKELKIHRVFQSSSNPPRFTFECTWPQLLHFSYIRYLENELRSSFGFQGTAIRMNFIRKN